MQQGLFIVQIYKKLIGIFLHYISGTDKNRLNTYFYTINFLHEYH